MKTMKEKNIIRKTYEAPSSFVVIIGACHICTGSEIEFKDKTGGADVREEQFDWDY